MATAYLSYLSIYQYQARLAHNVYVPPDPGPDRLSPCICEAHQLFAEIIRENSHRLTIPGGIVDL